MEHENHLVPVERTGRLLAPGRPAIYVAPADDHPLRGGWVDAARPVPLIQADIAGLLTTATGQPTTWTVHRFRDFYDLDLRPTTPLARLSRLGRGIARHGEPYARWAALSREANGRLTDFPDRYLGHFACRRAYIDFVVDQTADHRGLLPAASRQQLCGLYALRLVARQWADSVLFAPAGEGGVYAFARC